MQTFVEFEGVLVNVKSACWYAYSEAVKALGLARTEEATFWRVIRTGGDRGRIIRDARPRHLQTFDELFEKHLDDDQAVSSLEPHHDPETLGGLLRPLNVRSIVTTRSNPEARGKRLAARGLAGPLPPLTTIPRSTPLASAALGELAAQFAAGGLLVVLAASDALARAAGEANLPTVGIASGSATANRLAAAGARATFPNLVAFCEGRAASDPQLAKLGIYPANQPHSPDNANAPASSTPPGDRHADRERRRRERIARRRPH